MTKCEFLGEIYSVFNLFRGVKLSQCAVFLILQVVCSLLCFSESFSELLYLFLNIPLSLVEAAAHKTFLIRVKVSKMNASHVRLQTFCVTHSVLYLSEGLVSCGGQSSAERVWWCGWTSSLQVRPHLQNVQFKLQNSLFTWSESAYQIKTKFKSVCFAFSNLMDHFSL